jgi:hypothetical protein
MALLYAASNMHLIISMIRTGRPGRRNIGRETAARVAAPVAQIGPALVTQVAAQAEENRMRVAKTLH